MATKKPTTNDYLSEFLNEKTSEISDNVAEIKDQITSQNNDIKSSQMGYLNVDINAMPLGMFYKPGTQIKIRSATVSEVEAYAIVDDMNPMDVTEKMNQLLSSCVKVILSNGMTGSYKDIRDGDRLYLIFMIRELTFKHGTTIAKGVQCESCGHDFKIPYRSTGNKEQPKTFSYNEMSEELERFYNPDYRAFEFKIGELVFRLAPPTIGIQEIFFNEIKTIVSNSLKPNFAFMKIMPYILWDRSTITSDGIKKKEDEFKKYDMDTFQILNHAVGLMQFGIKELQMLCPKCGQEVRTPMTFPDGASSLFLFSDPFAKLAR